MASPMARTTAPAGSRRWLSGSRSGVPIGLVDFDGWDHIGQGYSLAEALREPRVKFGHAFVLAGMLTGERVWE